MSQKPMTKTQLVANLAEATGSDKVTANRALEALADIVSKEVAAGGAVTLPGLGKFQCRLENSLIAQFGKAATPNPADTICTNIKVLSACFHFFGSIPAGCKKCFTTSRRCF